MIMCTSDPDAVVLDGLTKSFGGTRAVSGVTLRVPRGQTLALSSAIQKLDARNRIEAVKLAEENGWL